MKDRIILYNCNVKYSTWYWVPVPVNYEPGIIPALSDTKSWIFLATVIAKKYIWRVCRLSQPKISKFHSARQTVREKNVITHHTSHITHHTCLWFDFWFLRCDSSAIVIWKIGNAYRAVFEGPERHFLSVPIRRLTLTLLHPIIWSL
jgi:hypothetical protein